VVERRAGPAGAVAVDDLHLLTQRPSRSRRSRASLASQLVETSESKDPKASARTYHAELRPLDRAMPLLNEKAEAWTGQPHVRAAAGNPLALVELPHDRVGAGARRRRPRAR
jgi:hypothetical protein